MGTLCKNCPVRNIQKETGQACTTAFALRYGNSCVNLDITKHIFEKELKEFAKEKENQPKKVNTPKRQTKKSDTPKKENKSRTLKKKETVKTE